jgi:hypothetical protein
MTQEEKLTNEFIKGAEWEKERCRIIIEYLCNKNSRPISQGGINYGQFFDDMQDFEHSLMD